MRIVDERNAPPDVLAGLRIVVLGYGNQGRPQALNMRDSGLDVAVAARSGGQAWRRAERDGFAVLEPADGAESADVLMLLVPDEVQAAVFEEQIRDRLRPGAALCFAHGFSVAFGRVGDARYDLVMVAPKGQGQRLREAYLEGSGLPCLFAVENDATGKARAVALSIARGLGCLRVGAFETTFREEAVSDLFGEQAILVGGVPALVKRAYGFLVERGFSPEVAYFECVHELKIIVDLITRHGFSGMRRLISGTAAWGGLRYGERLVTDETQREMELLFERIDSGEFAADWLAEARRGRRELERLVREESGLDVEETGQRLRGLFPRREKASAAEEEGGRHK